MKARFICLALTFSMMMPTMVYADTPSSGNSTEVEEGASTEDEDSAGDENSTEDEGIVFTEEALDVDSFIRGMLVEVTELSSRLNNLVNNENTEMYFLAQFAGVLLNTVTILNTSTDAEAVGIITDISQMLETLANQYSAIGGEIDFINHLGLDDLDFVDTESVNGNESQRVYLLNNIDTVLFDVIPDKVNEQLTASISEYEKDETGNYDYAAIARGNSDVLSTVAGVIYVLEKATTLKDEFSAKLNSESSRSYTIGTNNNFYFNNSLYPGGTSTSDDLVTGSLYLVGKKLIEELEDREDKTVTHYYNNFNDEVKALIKIVQDGNFQSQEVVANPVSVSEPGSEFITQLATVKRKDGSYKLDNEVDVWESVDGSEIRLTSSYLAMIASTAVYTPFVSKVGDTDYIEALKSLAPSNEEDALMGLFNDIKILKKPLYAIEWQAPKIVGTVHGTVNGTVSTSVNVSDFSNSLTDGTGTYYNGTANRITLSKLLSYLEGKSDIGFTTVKGTFSPGRDSNSWSFFQASSKATNPEEWGNNTVLFDATIFEGTEIPAEEVISTNSYTDILFSIGVSAETPVTGLMLLNNVHASLRNTSYFIDNSASFLYMNVFGDIVLDDDTVIVPGAANPLLYYSDGAGYNPYTVAFQNSYPQLAEGGGFISSFTSEDAKKFILFITDKESDAMSFSGLSERALTTSDLANYDYFTKENVAIREFDSLGFETRVVDSSAVSVYPYFYCGGSSYQTTLSLTDSKVIGTIFSDYENKSTQILTFNSSVTNTGMPIFPYVYNGTSYGEQSEYLAAKLIAQNMFWYFTHDDNYKVGSTANTNIREDYIFQNFLVEGLQGSALAINYEKNIAISNVILDENTSKVNSVLKEIAYAISRNLADIQGTLGILPADTNIMFGVIMQFFRTFSTYFYIFFIAVFVFRYARRGDLTYTSIMTLLACIFFFVFVYIVPTMVPIAYNSIGNIMTETLVSDVLLYNSEQYSTTYDKAGEFGIEDDYDTSTVSVTIYRMNEKQLRVFADRFNVDYNDFRYGDKLVLAPGIGLYIQGDSLKVNLDVLFLNNPVYGDYFTSTDTGNQYYYITSDKMTSSPLDFYMPFYQMEDGFIQTLNQLLQQYSIPRYTSTYLDGLVKDSFLVYSYTTSIPFLYGDSMADSGLFDASEYLSILDRFPDASDFLNIGDWIHNPDEQMRDTIWYNTMYSHGYYDQELGEIRRLDLINYVNYHTRLFLIRNTPQVASVSDENIIKITALQATMYFNSRISEIWNVAHPIAFNQEELKLDDVLLTTLTTENDRFIAHHFDIVSYINSSYGLLGLILFIVLITLAAVVVLLINFSFPLMYAVASILLIYRLLADKPVGSIIRGYFKATVLVSCIYTAFLLIITQLPKFMTGFSMLLVLTVLFGAVVSMLLLLVRGVLINAFELGDKGIGASFGSSKIGQLVAPMFSRAGDFMYNATAYDPYSSVYAENTTNEYTPIHPRVDDVSVSGSGGVNISGFDADRDINTSNQRFIMNQFDNNN